MGAIPTLKRFLLLNGVTGKPTTTEMDALWAAYDEFVWKRVQELRASPDLPVGIKALNQFLAESVIEDHLGTAWLEENIIEPHRSSLAKDYLNLQEHLLYKALSLHRVQELARRLYQLQSFDWFDRILEAVRTRELSGASFELDVLWLMQIASVHVEAREEIGVRGADFDFSALMKGEYVPVEAKAKGDRTPWSKGTVVNTVKAAARQLPKGRTGLLLIRVPSAWIGPRLEAEYSEALAEGVRQTSRVGAIISVLDKVHLLAGNSANVARHFDYFASHNCPDHIWDFCMRFRQYWDAGLTQMAPAPPF